MARAHIWYLFILFLFVDVCIILCAPFVISYKGFFPYKEIIESYHMPWWIGSLANFDGAQYLLIVSQGYQQFQQALFPLYPLLISGVGYLFGNNHLVTGLLISISAFLCSLFILNAYFIHIGKKPREIFWIFLMLLVFPTSYYFHTVYTESLFLLLFSISLYAFAKKQYVLAGVSSLFTSLTRLMGIFLMLVFFIQRFYTHKKKWTKYELITSIKKMFQSFSPSFVFAIIAPVMGLVLYMVYLWIVYDNPLYFVDAQSAFDANRTTSGIVLFPQVIYRYVKILFTVSGDMFYQALFEFVICNGVLVVLFLDAWKRWKHRSEKKNGIYVSILLFSFINIILPTLTGTLSSTTRYALMSLSFFIYMGEISSKWIKIITAVFLFCLHIIMLGLFVQGYFVG